ncbi:RNA polymerase sigma factor [Haliangium ochraceum]|uniref:RNA polymerase, sigma-24 subunit, ECF subfamily n=1 Tax=Haliangium ochraceum (strain DSM 14365 / JCM 11303 / SMP-2) TaxID=502025 RepID=D0LTI3_HALO1|nr:sigma-70 family RNA polymerase sigma factor [Haliangium ochraceum]ACY13878.1 RNA polymerase, sigma-24 subunit, ECF subfamily [Haliangium ochraceum DSM 14365]
MDHDHRDDDEGKPALAEDSEYIDENVLGDADVLEDDDERGESDGDEVSDAELFASWAAGDKHAADVLIRRYMDKLSGYFAAKLSQGDSVADLVQQTLEGCHRAAPSFRGECSFRTFLYRVAGNKLRDFLRGKARRPRAEDIDEISVADLNPGPSTIRRQNHRQAVLLDALRSLPLQMQELLEFRYQQDLSIREIAEILGIEVSATKSRLRRAKEALRRALGTSGADAL